MTKKEQEMNINVGDLYEAGFMVIRRRRNYTPRSLKPVKYEVLTRKLWHVEEEEQYTGNHINPYKFRDYIWKPLTEDQYHELVDQYNCITTEIKLYSSIVANSNRVIKEDFLELYTRF